MRYGGRRNRKPTKPKKKLWSQAEHGENTKKLATPREYPTPPDPDRGPKKPLSALMKRIKKLVIILSRPKPKKYKIPPFILVNGKKIMRPHTVTEVNFERLAEMAIPNPRCISVKYVKVDALPYIPITPQALSYIPSPRINIISEPKRYFGINHNKKDPYSVSPYALQFEATVRYLVLATPKKNIGTNHNKKNPFSVSPSALKYVASPRYVVLATPKPTLGVGNNKPNPNTVSKAALSFIAGPRYKVLARPNPFWGVSNNKKAPFKVSKYAMQYVATPRIIYLARPARRYTFLQTARKLNLQYY